MDAGVGSRSCPGFQTGYPVRGRTPGRLSNVIVRHARNGVRSSDRVPAPIPEWIENKGIPASQVSLPAALISVVDLLHRHQTIVAVRPVQRIAPPSKTRFIFAQWQDFSDLPNPGHSAVPCCLGRETDHPFASSRASSNVGLAACKRQRAALKARRHAGVMSENVSPNPAHAAPSAIIWASQSMAAPFSPILATNSCPREAVCTRPPSIQRGGGWYVMPEPPSSGCSQLGTAQIETLPPGTDRVWPRLITPCPGSDAGRSPSLNDSEAT